MTPEQKLEYYGISPQELKELKEIELDHSASRPMGITFDLPDGVTFDLRETFVLPQTPEEEAADPETPPVKMVKSEAPAINSAAMEKFTRLWTESAFKDDDCPQFKKEAIELCPYPMPDFSDETWGESPIWDEEVHLLEG
jgi:hypothetical protein